MLILFQSVSYHGCHGLFLFLIGQFQMSILKTSKSYELKPVTYTLGRSFFSFPKQTWPSWEILFGSQCHVLFFITWHPSCLLLTFAFSSSPLKLIGQREKILQKASMKCLSRSFLVSSQKTIVPWKFFVSDCVTH